MSGAIINTILKTLSEGASHLDDILTREGVMDGLAESIRQGNTGDFLDAMGDAGATLAKDPSFVSVIDKINDNLPQIRNLESQIAKGVTDPDEIRNISNAVGDILENGTFAVAAKSRITGQLETLALQGNQAQQGMNTKLAALDKFTSRLTNGALDRTGQVLSSVRDKPFRSTITAGLLIGGITIYPHLSDYADSAFPDNSPDTPEEFRAKIEHGVSIDSEFEQCAVDGIVSSYASTMEAVEAADKVEMPLSGEKTTQIFYDGLKNEFTACRVTHGIPQEQKPFSPEESQHVNLVINGPTATGS